MRKCLIVASLLLLSAPAWGQSYDNSQGEGNYNGSNSQGAATYYNGGGKDTYGDGANYDHSGAGAGCAYCDHSGDR